MDVLARILCFRNLSSMQLSFAIVPVSSLGAVIVRLAIRVQ
jgi:hypothetical protein